jgi:hypothetical protein
VNAPASDGGIMALQSDGMPSIRLYVLGSSWWWVFETAIENDRSLVETSVSGFYLFYSEVQGNHTQLEKTAVDVRWRQAREEQMVARS